MSTNSQPPPARTSPTRTVLVIESDRQPSHAVRTPPGVAPFLLNFADNDLWTLELIQIVTHFPADTEPGVDASLQKASGEADLHPALHLAFPRSRGTRDSIALSH